MTSPMPPGRFSKGEVVSGSVVGAPARGGTAGAEVRGEGAAAVSLSSEFPFSITRRSGPAPAAPRRRRPPHTVPPGVRACCPDRSRVAGLTGGWLSGRRVAARRVATCAVVGRIRLCRVRRRGLRGRSAGRTPDTPASGTPASASGPARRRLVRVGRVVLLGRLLRGRRPDRPSCWVGPSAGRAHWTVSSAPAARPGRMRVPAECADPRGWSWGGPALFRPGATVQGRSGF